MITGIITGIIISSFILWIAIGLIISPDQLSDGISQPQPQRLKELYKNHNLRP